MPTTADHCRAVALSLPGVVEKLWWGKSVLGLRVTLAAASPALVEALLRQAHAARAAKKTRPPRRK